MIEIKPWSRTGIQKFTDDGKVYVISSLIYKARDLPVQRMPLEHLNIYNLYPEIKSTRDWIGHIKSVLEADLERPIILDDDGYIMDGRHRIAKALLEGAETIKFVRFKETPSPDYYEKEK